MSSFMGRGTLATKTIAEIGVDNVLPSASPLLLDRFLQVRGGSELDGDEDEETNGDETSQVSGQEEQSEEEVIEAAPQPTSTTTTTATAAIVDEPKPSAAAMNPKLQNAIERTGPACIMLLLLYLLIKVTGEDGLFLIIPLMQYGMYKESTGIIEEHHNNDGGGQRGNNFGLEINIEKWWWFATAFTSTTGRFLLENYSTRIGQYDLLSFLNNKDLVNLICFGMVAIGLVMSVVGMASHADASADRFRSYLGEVASSHFALIFLIGQSSLWIQTIKSFGIGWVLFPALLVIVNDTMAYVFGVLFGQHKLLPKLSPKKTVEGFVGAGLSTIGISIPLLGFFFSFIEKRSGDHLSVCFEKFSSVFSINANGSANVMKHAIVMAVYTSLISPFGGFLASAVKRAHGAKDFGSLIPGHGGVVDRFDCQVVTAPFVFLYLKYCMGGAVPDIVADIVE